jgi:hypothetical protein
MSTHYVLDGPRIESWWSLDCPDPSRPALGPTQPAVQWVQGLFQGVRGPERGVKEYGYTTASSRDLHACYRVKFTFTVTLNKWRVCVCVVGISLHGFSPIVYDGRNIIQLLV